MLCVACFIKYLGSALMLRVKLRHKKSTGYQALTWLFAEPADTEHLKEIGLAKVSTLIAFTNITYMQYVSMCMHAGSRESSFRYA